MCFPVIGRYTVSIGNFRCLIAARLTVVQIAIDKSLYYMSTYTPIFLQTGQ